MPPADWGAAIPGGFFHEPTHTYRNAEGHKLLSPTRVFEHLGMSNFDGVPEATMEWKRLFGSACHKAIELLVFHHLDWDTCDDAILPAVCGMEQYLASIQYEPIAAEECMIASIDGMQFGMTLDHRGTAMYKGTRRPLIADVKTGSKASTTWHWQLGGYSCGVPKSPLGPYLGLVVQVDQDGKVTPHWVDIHPRRREFGILLAAANLKLNAGLSKS